MDNLVSIFTSVDFWKFTIPLLGAVVAWFLNERRKRLWEQYQRKEANYKELIRCLKGFYEGVADAAPLRAEFLSQLNLCWLYCPDKVILKGYAFMDALLPERDASDQEKDEAMGAFIAAIRQDLLSRKLVTTTELHGTDFRHFRVIR